MSGEGGQAHTHSLLGDEGLAIFFWSQCEGSSQRWSWRRHIEQLQPRYGVLEDADPGEVAISLPETSCSHTSTDSLQPATPGPPPISPVEGVPLVSDPAAGPEHFCDQCRNPSGATVEGITWCTH